MLYIITENKIITEDEKEAMEPGDTGVGKFYCLYKVHKEHSLQMYLQRDQSSVAAVATPKILESLLIIISSLLPIPTQHISKIPLITLGNWMS